MIAPKAANIVPGLGASILMMIQDTFIKRVPFPGFTPKMSRRYPAKRNRVPTPTMRKSSII